jgi:hypothetical protein
MRDVETIICGVLNNTIAVKELTTNELDAVVDELVEIGQSLIGTDNHEAGVAILEVLDQAIDFRSMEVDAGFEKAILEAEARGSTYWEFEENNVH